MRCFYDSTGRPIHESDIIQVAPKHKIPKTGTVVRKYGVWFVQGELQCPLRQIMNAGYPVYIVNDVPRRKSDGMSVAPNSQLGDVEDRSSQMSVAPNSNSNSNSQPGDVEDRGSQMSVTPNSNSNSNSINRPFLADASGRLDGVMPNSNSNLHTCEEEPSVSSTEKVDSASSTSSASSPLFSVDISSEEYDGLSRFVRSEDASPARSLSRFVRSEDASPARSSSVEEGHSVEEIGEADEDSSHTLESHSSQRSSRPHRDKEEMGGKNRVLYHGE